MVKKISEPRDKIEIEVTKSFPFSKIKQVLIVNTLKDSWNNKSIVLDNEDANYVYYALGDILGHKLESHQHLPSTGVGDKK